MANVVEWSPDRAGTLAATVQTTRPTFSGSAIRHQPQGPSYRETLTNMIQRENFALDMRRLHGNAEAQDGNVLDQPSDPSWNPHAYIRENWSEEDQQEFEFEQRAGIFDDAINAADLDLQRTSVRQERAMLESIEGGAFTAQLLGGLVGGITDPTSYIPLAGQVNRIRRLGTIGKGALLGATATAIPELALQTTQELRTRYEGFMNVGVGTALGGGAGAFVSLMRRRNALHPSNPHNPLREENFASQGDGYRTPEGEIDVVGGSDSAGAARVVDQGDTRDAPGLLTDTPFLGRVTDRIGSVTPAGRAGQWSSSVGRGIARRLMDMGGRLSRANLEGTPTVHSAEDWKRDFLRLREQVLQTGDRLHRALNRELGQTATEYRLSGIPGLGKTFQGTITPEDFSELARQQLLGTFDDAAARRVQSDYGPAASERIVAATKEYAEEIHTANAEFERELLDLGLLKDDAEISRLTGERDAARAAVTAERERMASAPDTGTAPDGASLRQLIEDRAATEAALAAEEGKAAAMGRDYGHAQLWSPSKILASQEQFEDFLLEALAADPDAEWLSGGYGLTKSEFEKLGQEPVTIVEDGVTREVAPEDGDALRRSILRDWAGDEFEYNLQRAEAQEGAAQRGVEEADYGLAMTMRALGWVTDKARRATATEIRTFRNRLMGERESARNAKAAADANNRAFTGAATAARQATLDRQNAFTEVVSPEAIAEIEGVVAKASERLAKTIAGGEGGSSLVNAQRAYAAAVRQQYGLYARSPDIDVSAKLAELEGQAKAAQAEVKRAETRQADMDERVARLEQKATEAQAKRDKLVNAREAVSASRADAAKELRVAQKDLRKALRALRKAKKATPLSNAVEEISRRLAQNDGLPSYQRIGEHADRIAKETGRTKARRIHLTPEMRKKGEELGFLRTDLPNVLTVQYDQLSGWIGLHRGLDMGPKGRYGSWDDVVRAVADDYRALRDQTTDPKAVAKLNGEHKALLQDLGLLKDRLLGTENAGVDKDGWAYWLSKKMRQMSFTRFGAGFLAPSMTDIASVAARTGSLGRLIKEHGPQVIQIMRGMDHGDLRALVNAQELGTNGVRMARAFDIEDGFEFMGIGAEGTLKHGITSKIDHAMGFLTDKTNVVSGMRAWNRMGKIAAGIHRAYTMRDWVAKYDDLLPRQKTDLAQLGIGKSEAERINRFIEKHGNTEANGHWDPGLEDWGATREGREAARDFRIAIERDMSQAIFTPGIGDTPGLMSHALGKLWLQFQSYAFTFLNRYLAPTSQRLKAYRDPVAIASLGHLMWSSLLVVVAKDVLRGHDPSERFKAENWPDTMFEMVDRSGMMHFMSPYVDSTIKASAPMQEAAFGKVHVGPTSRFSRNNWWHGLLGANYGLLRDAGDAGGALAAGDTERAIEKGLLLAPYNTYWRLMHQLADD